MSDPNVKSGGLVVEMRPQISVELTNYGEVVINTATVDAGFQSVEMKDVSFPLDCAKDVAEAILRLLAEEAGEPIASALQQFEEATRNVS